LLLLAILKNDRLYVAVGSRKRDSADDRLLRTRPTFSKSLMVSVGVSSLGLTSIHFVEPGVKINGRYYRDVLLMEDLPKIREFSEFCVFQQDGASAHRARETVALLTNETPACNKSYTVAPNSPDRNPVDYKIWGCMQKTEYKTKVRDFENFLQAWNDLDQRIIDSALCEWPLATSRMRRS